MKVIPFEIISKLNIAPKKCVEWVEEALKLKYISKLPEKISLTLENGSIFYNTMPCLIPSINRFGVKEVSRYPKRNPSISGDLLLYDIQSGALLSLMDANWITAMRTGAVAASSINLLQNSTATNYSFLGLGITARATLLCLLDSNSEKHFNIKLLKYKDQAESFIERFKEFKNVSFDVIETHKELICNADVIVSCVTVAENLIGKDSWFKKGVLVVPIHTRGFQNCDLFFDKVFADDEGHVKQFKYFDKFKKFDEVARVLLKENNGRENDEERILVYNIGIALHDIYFASKIYDLLKDKGFDEINLNEIQEKFWI